MMLATLFALSFAVRGKPHAGPSVEDEPGELGLRSPFVWAILAALLLAWPAKAENQVPGAVAQEILIKTSLLTLNDANVTGSVDPDVSITLENSWAVRALAAAGLTASVTLGTGDFSNASITPTAPTASLTLTDGSNIGDVSFDIDVDALTGLTASDTLTITVVSP